MVFSFVRMTVIEVAKLQKRYGTQVAVEDVSFSVEAGQIFGIIGRNGAGKTTIVECVSGLRAPDGGSLRVLGLDPRRDHEKLRRHVGVQLQESMLQDRITVAEALTLFASFYPNPARAEQLMDELGLTASARKPYAKLSGGQKQRLSIALALIGNPKVAILDELTTGLDPQARRETWQLVSQVRDRGVTILLVTHFMDEADRLCDRIAVIHRGRVAAIDTPAGLTARAAIGQVLRFGTATSVDTVALKALESVSTLEHDCAELAVTGNGAVLTEVVAELARQHLVPLNLRVEQPNLDDAFLTLTGESLTGEGK